MKYRIRITDEIRRTVEGWDFRRLLNQVCCPTWRRAEVAELREYGAMFFHPEERGKLDGQIARFKAACDMPPFIVSDLESGPGDMILGASKFPTFMGVSQTGSEELVYEVGRIAASEAGEIGYNWTFSPVADLAIDPDSPVVSSRSPGHTPAYAEKMAGAYIRGLQDNGMMATIKHFPGDGFASWDQHLTTPINPLGMEDWHAGPGRVFKTLIDGGAMAVMPGHIALPAYDEADDRGLYPPATLSKRLLLDLLRGELGFEGLIVSDAVEMGGAVGYMNYYDACAATLENGCDMLLFPRIDERFYREMEARLANGRLTLEALRDRACRVVALKEQFGLTSGQDRTIEPIDRTYSESVASRVADAAITVVRDRGSLIPVALDKRSRVLHAVAMNGSDRYGDMYARILSALRERCGHVDQWIDPGPDRLFEAAVDHAYDLILCSIGSELSYGLNVVRLHDEVARNMMGGWMKLGTKVVFVAHHHPFVHKEYEAAIDTIVNTYGDIACTAELLIAKLTGELPIERELRAHD
ncbi:glycoside hydrolase family 3 N-terminal domain-containing protein [Cohnella sp. GCM10027633]|uniref:glycoside hydrolase family 3 N-terminal domain-containing protein n=1 Tax=unclassified Cohnella TaxID=2636738 RepID=UPI00362EAC08